MKRISVLILFLSLLTLLVSAQEDVELGKFLPGAIEVRDTPSDDGDSVLIVWEMTGQETDAPACIQYIILQAEKPDAPFKPLEYIPIQEETCCSDKPKLFGFASKMKNYCFAQVDAERGKEYYYKVAVTDGETTETIATAVSGTAQSNIFNWNKFNNLVVLILMIALVIYFYNKAKTNPNMFIRKIPGLEAIDEAVGRATEMGKPILYLTGSYDIEQISTISSVNILSHVAKKTADYRSRIIVPNRWPVCMTVCQEIVRGAYTNAGRPEEYDEKDVFFIAGEQFSYTAAVDGLMMREKPAANFFLGTFAAESLLLAEAGSTTGAIQIAGTDSTYQIPFFIVACDYCLIGEELYAASAYLSHEPKLMATLKTSDTMKILITILLFVGTILFAINAIGFDNEFDLLNKIKDYLTAR
jgi:hypothetical protein